MRNRPEISKTGLPLGQKQDKERAKKSRLALNNAYNAFLKHKDEIKVKDSLDFMDTGNKDVTASMMFEAVLAQLYAFKQNIVDKNGLYKQVQVPNDDNIVITLPDRDFAIKMSQSFRQWAYFKAQNAEDEELQIAYTDFYWRFLRFESPDWFDSYCQYIEKDAEPEKKLYTIRRKSLLPIVTELQKLADGIGKILFIHMPPRTGKTLLMVRFAAWFTSRKPSSTSLYTTYKESVGTTFLNGYREILSDPFTYKHKEVFPLVEIAATDSKNNKVWLNRKTTYATLSAKGIDSGLNGEYDCSGLFIADDVLSGIDEVMNPDVLANRKMIFENNAKSRAKESAIQVYMGTLWDENDIYSTQWKFYEENPEGRKVPHVRILVPALDPDTDESNFDYEYGQGFSTGAYRQIRAKFEENDDLASWFCQYQQDPKSRQGALFTPQGIHTYNGNLPETAPLKIVSACDVALGGEDYLAMPIAYVYEDGRVFIPDVVYDNAEKHVTQPKVAAMIATHEVTNAFFEANAGGEGYANDVERILNEKLHYKLNVVTKYAQQMVDVKGRKANPKTDARKEQRIFNQAQTIRQFYFLEPSVRSLEYRKFMNGLFGFQMNNRNKHKHDDAPDSLAMLAVFLDTGSGVKRSRYIPNLSKLMGRH